MTTPGGVPNLPAGALTLETLQSRLQDLTTAAMRGRAAERIPGTYDGSTGGNPLNDLSPFGILTTLFAGFNSHVANADPADINGPEDLPGLLVDFVESLPVIGQFVGLLEAIVGTYDGDDPVLLEIQEVFGLIRDLFSLISLDPGDLPTPEEVWGVVLTNFIKPLGDFVSLVGGLLNPSWIPGLDASKIISGTIAQSFLNITNIPGSIISGLLSGANIPTLDASKIGTGTFGTGLIPGLDASKIISGLFGGGRIPALDASKITSGTFVDTLLPDIAPAKSTAMQGIIDALQNAAKNTPGATGQNWEAIESAWAALPTQIWNKLGGNNDARAGADEATAALATIANTISQQGIAISNLQNLLDGADGFKASVMFRQPETVVLTAAGAFSYTAPSWFNTVTDYLDVILIGGGGGGGGGLSDDSQAGADSWFKSNGVTKATGAGGAAVGPGPGGGTGASPGNQTYLDILYQGGAGGVSTQPGTKPGGGGGGGNFFGVIGKGGNCGIWGTTTLGPGTAVAPLTGYVGPYGAGTTGGFGAREGGDGRVWVRARPAMPAAFTSMGTQLLPTFKLNTGVALTDAMTSAATWSRVPPGGASGGHMIKIRSNSAGTTYVYLWVKVVSGVTNYEIGRVSSGTKAAWKTGTIGDAVPFNTFSISSDSGYVYTASVNGTPFDSYDDTLAHGSSLGASYREGSWGSSDSALPGSIVQFAFLDTGTPARIVSSSVATAQTPSSAGTYVDLATTGPSVTLNVPPSGEITVDVSASMSTVTNLNVIGYMGFVLSGTNTLAAADSRAAFGRNPTAGVLGAITRRVHLTGLNPGTTTVKAVFKHSAASATFSDRNIIVDPRP